MTPQAKPIQSYAEITVSDIILRCINYKLTLKLKTVGSVSSKSNAYREYRYFGIDRAKETHISAEYKRYI